MSETKSLLDPAHGLVVTTDDPADPFGLKVSLDPDGRLNQLRYKGKKREKVFRRLMNLFVALIVGGTLFAAARLEKAGVDLTYEPIIPIAVAVALLLLGDKFVRTRNATREKALVSRLSKEARQRAEQSIDILRKTLSDVRDLADAYITDNFDIGRCVECGHQTWLPERVNRSRAKMYIDLRCESCEANTTVESKSSKFPHAEWRAYDFLSDIKNFLWIHNDHIENLSKFCPEASFAEPWTIVGEDYYDDDVLASQVAEDRTRKGIPSKVKKIVWTRDNGQCRNCGASDSLQYDHIIPFSKGGGNQPENLQLLCRSCNLRKSAKIQ